MAAKRFCVAYFVRCCVAGNGYVVVSFFVERLNTSEKLKVKNEFQYLLIHSIFDDKNLFVDSPCVLILPRLINDNE